MYSSSPLERIVSVNGVVMEWWTKHCKQTPCRLKFELYYKKNQRGSTGKMQRKQNAAKNVRPRIAKFRFLSNPTTLFGVQIVDDLRLFCVHYSESVIFQTYFHCPHISARSIRYQLSVYILLFDFVGNTGPLHDTTTR